MTADETRGPANTSAALQGWRAAERELDRARRQHTEADAVEGAAETAYRSAASGRAAAAASAEIAQEALEAAARAQELSAQASADAAASLQAAQDLAATTESSVDAAAADVAAARTTYKAALDRASGMREPSADGAGEGQRAG